MPLSLLRAQPKLIPKPFRFAKAAAAGARSPLGIGAGRPEWEVWRRRDGDSNGSARRLDLVRRGTQTLERREDPCADARAALCEHGVRGPAGLWRRSVQAARAHQPAD